MNLQIEKAKNSILYLVQAIPDLYYTKLLKLLYYYDFISVLETGRPVTSDVYFHLPYGPVPSFIKDQLEDLKNDVKEKKKEIAGDMEGLTEVPSVFEDSLILEKKGLGFVLKSKEDVTVDFNHISNYQKDLLDDLVSEYRDITTKQLVTKIHSEPPYAQTTPGSIIGYKMAFHLKRENILPKRTYDFAPEVSQAEFFSE